MYSVLKYADVCKWLKQKTVTQIDVSRIKTVTRNRCIHDGAWTSIVQEVPKTKARVPCTLSDVQRIKMK